MIGNIGVIGAALTRGRLCEEDVGGEIHGPENDSGCVRVDTLGGVSKKSSTTLFESKTEICNVGPNWHLVRVQYHVDESFVFELVENLRRVTVTI